jgi:predicted nucleic acid-binding protein
VKILLDTNVDLGALHSAETRDRFRTTFYPLTPLTHLSAVVAYELGVNAVGRRTRELLQEYLRPLERTGRVVSPLFQDWTDAADIISAIHMQKRQLRSKLPGLIDDVLIALSAKRIGATVFTYNGEDFRLIHRRRDFALRVLEA